MNRHIRLLSWFFLLWLMGVNIYWNIWSWRATADSLALHIVVTLLMCVHPGIYWIGFLVKMRRGAPWLFLCLQTTFVLLLTHMTHAAMLILVLSRSSIRPQAISTMLMFATPFKGY